jgi:hypothetical protein
MRRDDRRIGVCIIATALGIIRQKRQRWELNVSGSDRDQA